MSNDNPQENKHASDKIQKTFLKRFRWLLIGLAAILVIGTGAAVRGIIHNWQLEGGNNSGSNSGYDKNEGKIDYRQDVFSESHFYTDDANARFTFSPVNIDDITEIVPLGYAASVAGSDETGGGTHNIPSDHMYVRCQYKNELRVFKVYAVADCYLANIIYHKGVWQGADGTLHALDDYNLQFQVSKNLFVLLTCLTDITPELKAQVGELQEGDQNFRAIPIKAGQLLGQSGGSPVLNAIDLWAIDLSKPAQFIHPEWYGVLGGESVNPLDYFTEPVRSQLYDKLPQRPEPRVGQFAYDIDGKLVGNWFPLTNPKKDLNIGPESMPKLGFFYWNYDPSVIMIGYLSENMAWVVKNNGPDPATIDVNSGTVKYELMSERNRDPNNPAYFKTEATMLVQMLENRKIKMELFKGQTADEVSGFDVAALEFYR